MEEALVQAWVIGALSCQANPVLRARAWKNFYDVSLELRDDPELIERYGRESVGKMVQIMLAVDPLDMCREVGRELG